MNFKLCALILSVLMKTAWADVPSTHGMVLFGNQQLYASHLPMFHAPHDYQLVFELNLDAIDNAALEQFATEKAKGKSFFTLAPERMDLSKVISGEIKNFSAQLYEGHFEKNGKYLGQVKIHVGKFLLNSKLNPNPIQEDNYLLFGRQNEYYAVHIIQGRPNLDHIVMVSAPYTFDIPFCGRRICPDPNKVLLPDTQLPILINGKKSGSNIIAPQVGEGLGSVFEAFAEITQVIYSEREELSH
jgi:hypothetical protein